MINFDIIGDMYLGKDVNFCWQNKPTSLYCVIHGNITDNIVDLKNTLKSLTDCYKAVFYIPGILEYSSSVSRQAVIDEILTFSQDFPNLCILYQQIAVMDGLAIIGANGWNEESCYLADRMDDFVYLSKALKRLQVHPDIERIMIVTGCVPMTNSNSPESQIKFEQILLEDTERKVKYWIFGSHPTQIDLTVNQIRYVNNPVIAKRPYWPLRIAI